MSGPSAEALPPGTRRVLVTGGGTGIGRAVAERLLAAGGRVAVAGRRAGPLEALAAAHPGRAAALPCDLADAAERGALLARAAEALGGPLDGLVHCAGVAHHRPLGTGPADAPRQELPEAELRVQLELNLVAPLRLGEQALGLLAPGGAVVLVASTLAHRPVETSAVYSASKAGLLSVMRSLALAGAPRGLRVNAVSPGVVDTDMVRALRLAPGEAPPGEEGERQARVQAQLAGLAALHPLGRLGLPGEVAGAVVHLLGAPWTTGAELVIDGGLLLRS
jgi:NAD(P)-dependent dehydrogenase (short-subunit alcohol dehydrogenase family)